MPCGATRGSWVFPILYGPAFVCFLAFALAHVGLWLSVAWGAETIHVRAPLTILQWVRTGVYTSVGVAAFYFLATLAALIHSILVTRNPVERAGWNAAGEVVSGPPCRLSGLVGEDCGECVDLRIVSLDLAQVSFHQLNRRQLARPDLGLHLGQRQMVRHRLAIRAALRRRGAGSSHCPPS